MISVTEMPSYVAVIIHYRAPELLDEAIRSLLGQTHSPARILVVDNSAAIEHLELKPDLVQQIELIRAERNGGYAYAVNLARGPILTASPPDKVLVMTQDVLWESDTVEKLAAASTRDRACVGPRIMLRSDRSRLFSRGGRITFGGHTPHLKANRVSQRSHSREITDVDWLDGAIMFLDLESLNDVGWFDEDYFLYYEEVDLCHRLRTVLGKRVSVVEDAIAYQEPGNYTPYYRHRNQVLFWRKNFGSWQIWPAMAYQFMRSSLRALKCRDLSITLWAARGLWDGIRGVGGPPPIHPFAHIINKKTTSI